MTINQREWWDDEWYWNTDRERRKGLKKKMTRLERVEQIRQFLGDADTALAMGLGTPDSDMLTMISDLLSELDATSTLAWKYRSLLKEKKTGDCWCEMGVGNPMYHTHTELCNEIREHINDL